jgi:hypothetical protein
MKKVIENGRKRPLEEFAQCAVIYLEKHPECDEVVQQANHIIELDHDTMTFPSLIYELPEGYEYNFSEFIGVGRTARRPAPSQKPFSTL